MVIACDNPAQRFINQIFDQVSGLNGRRNYTDLFPAAAHAWKKGRQTSCWFCRPV